MKKICYGNNKEAGINADEKVYTDRGFKTYRLMEPGRVA